MYITICIVFFVLLVLGIILESDLRWHKKHPDANKRSVDIDEMLTRQGK